MVEVDSKSLADVPGLSRPHLADDLVLGDDASCVGGEDLEEFKLGGGEFEGFFAEVGFVVEQVESEGTGGDFGQVAVHAPSLYDLEPGEEFGGSKRFGDVVIGPGLQGFHFQRLWIPDTQDEHGNITPFAQSLEDLDSVESRESQIEQYDIGPLEGDFLESPPAFVRLTDFIVAGFEHHPEKAAHLLFIVDNEGFPHGWRVSTGRVMRNSAPPPVAFEARRSPFIARRSPREMASPRPVPPGGAPFARANFSKIWSSIPVGSPGPWSRIRICRV